jgi:hypothetical protein
MIFQPVPRRDSSLTRHNAPYLAYMEPLEVIGDGPDPDTEMYCLRRVCRKDNTTVGGIVPLDRICIPIEMAPPFNDPSKDLTEKECKLSFCNSMSAKKLYMNHYCDREIFYMFADI